MAYIRRRGCKCEDKKKCTCGAKYSFTVDIGEDPVTGKRKQKTGSGYKTQKEAKDAARAIEYELSEGDYVKEKDTSFEEFAEYWIKVYGLDAKVSTLYNRKTTLPRIYKSFKTIKIKDISHKMYQEFLYNMFHSGYAVETIKTTHSVAKLIFQKAVEDKIIKYSPALGVKIPKKQKTVEDIENNKEIPKYLEKEELAVFLAATLKRLTQNKYTCFLLMAYTGIRIGESCALKWNDIDFEEKTIRITKTYFNETGRTVDFQIIPPKSNSSIRVIEIDDIVIEALKKSQRIQKEIKMKYRDRYFDDDFVFAKETREFCGYPEVPITIRERMDSVLKKTKLNDSLTPHSLRHTHTSLLAEAGAGIEEIMERLGHEDDSITKRIYLHVTKPMKKGASQKFSNLMRSLIN